MAPACGSGRIRAGADPGPACYRRGGPLTVTDANVCVGKIQPAHFPAIFGPNGDQPLDAAVVAAKFAALAEEISARDRRDRATPREVAEGFLRIAVANMANAIKQVSVQKGHDVTRFALQCFGGAGGQHACLVADALGMETVFIHPYRRRAVGLWHGARRPDRDARAGGGSAAGRRRRCPSWRTLADRLAQRRRGGVGDAGRRARRASARARTLHLRYAGTEAALIVALRDHARRSSRTSPRRIAPASASPRRSARWSSKRSRSKRPPPARRCEETATAGARSGARRRRSTRVRMLTGGAEHDAPVFERTELLAGDRIAGPGADPRGQRHHRGRARLDGRGHRRWTT